MQTLKTLVLASLIAVTTACGYGSKNYNSMATAGAMPAIAQLSPGSTTAGGAAFTLTVNGSNFGTKAIVNWNGVAQTTTTFVTANQLMVAVPASMIANSGNVQVTVTNPATAGTGMYGTGGTLAETSTPMTFAIN
jgi:outer membrane lipopolysaccharide assembly protein LptE/RlpB